MSSEDWPEVRLSDLVDIKHGFAFAGQHFREEPSADVLVTPGNFATGGGFKDDKLKFYEGPVPEDFVLFPGDLLVTMTDLSKEAGTLGYPAFVPGSTRFRYLHNQRLGRVTVRDGASVDLGYLYYVLCSPAYRHEVLAGATGTTVKHTSPSRIGQFRFHLPPLADQVQIARTLGALDDKIELNRRMNRTLESIARAIFKSWFVDFDPVRKKMEGKTGGELGLPPSLAALFPDSLVDSAIGQVPQGWPAVPLSELVDVNPKYALRQAAEATYVEMANLPTDGARVTVTRPRPFQSGSRFKNGDVLVARITPCLENGKTALVDFLSPGETGWGSTEFLVLRRRLPVSPEYVYCLSRSDAFRDHAVGSMNGSSGRQRVPTEALEKFPTVRPNPDILTAFSRMAHSAVRQMAANDSESQHLRDLRDALLPLLLSGSVGARP